MARKTIHAAGGIVVRNGARPLIAQDLKAGLVPSKPDVLKRGQTMSQAIEII